MVGPSLVSCSFFIAIAFRLDRYFPKPNWLADAYGGMTARFRQTDGRRACGFTRFPALWSTLHDLGLALLRVLPLRGWFALCFGFGTLPLLFAQTQFMRLRNVSNRRLQMIQRIVAGFAALVVLWRLRGTLGIEAAIEWICT